MRYLLALFLAFSTPRVIATVSPRIVPENGSVLVTCRVSNNQNNRGVFVGIAGETLPDELVQSSWIELDGTDRDRVTYLVPFEHVPCEARVGFCDLREVVSGHEHSIFVWQGFEMAGCTP